MLDREVQLCVRFHKWGWILFWLEKGRFRGKDIDGMCGVCVLASESAEVIPRLF